MDNSLLAVRGINHKYIVVGGQHYIMVYGYTNVSDPNNMTKDNLVFVDPYAYGGQQYYDGNVGNIKKIGVAGSKHPQQVIWCK